MRIIRTSNYEEMSRAAASMIGAQVILNPFSVLGLATGSSPVGTYKQLIERCKAGELDFSGITCVNLDEYIGLGPNDEQSYVHFMRANLYDHINISRDNTYIPNGLAPDETAEGARYDALIDSLGGVDLQLLGIGTNGHIAFNEPDDVFSAGTHKVALTESTVESNKIYFENEADMPRHAYTMGIGNIMHARRIVMVASGKSKAAILREAFRGPITPQVPASVLQLHTNVTLIGDSDALSLLD